MYPILYLENINLYQKVTPPPFASNVEMIFLWIFLLLGGGGVGGELGRLFILFFEGWGGDLDRELMRGMHMCNVNSFGI